MAETWKSVMLEGDVVTLGDGSQLATSAAPTADADIANKKYVDDNIGGGSTGLLMVTTGNLTISANYSYLLAERFEVSSGHSVDIGSNAVLAVY